MEPKQKVQKTEQIIKALRKKLSRSGWDNALWPWWASSEFEQIIDTLQHYTETDKRWIPGANNMFRFLSTCPYNKLKLVMLVDMVSTVFESNDGIPMSNMNGIGVNRLVWEMMETMPVTENSMKRDKPKDLAVWAKQGVLMIPTAMTVYTGKTPHYDLWKPMIAYLIDHINHNKKEVPWVLLGGRAIEYRPMINTEHVQERKFYKPFKEDGLWIWVEERIVINDKEPIEWL